MNIAIMIGRLTADPVPRTTPSGVHVLNFSIAVRRKYAQEGQPQVDFFNCVAWNHTADFINKWFTKGSMIAIEGHLQSRTWDGNDGKKQYATEIVVDGAYFTGSRGENPLQHQARQQAAENQFVELGTIEEGAESDLPF